ncbi:hypothetical protein RGR602_CH01098 [Rhizobium gallicum bv. gallicum R602sp]|uniref:DUF1579 domain-containing protein n=1 Tax=Rhizobium gallicum bv. gallicum R602sp TaxID=1041138 RepID=A0A0B4WZW8_9HYPH|nr:DUF1579 domain-containing protein [Rhizobium gallicum]AJD40456.1 hypothetical protein RGR602_CH01098 [Rhizobium gallicum bv. gallicum R602sp]
METAKALEEHRFLERMVGVWDVTASEMTGDQQWTEIVRSLHGIWFVAEGNGEMPGGGAATTMLTLGYNAAKGKYVGSWIGSMMDHMWVYEGDVSADGKVLSLYTRGPDFQTQGAEQDYREQIIFADDDHRTFNSSAKQPDGSWKQFMEAHYTRKP